MLHYNEMVQIKMSNIRLVVLDFYKYLRVHLDEHLTSEYHSILTPFWRITEELSLTDIEANKKTTLNKDSVLPISGALCA